MLAPLLKSLAEEKVLLCDSRHAMKLPFPLSGVVRLVDRRGNTLGLVLDRETLLEIEEEIEASRPEFLAGLEASRRSGRVLGETVRKKIGLK